MTAIVTGGAGAIGRATAEALIRDGWSTLLVDQSATVHAVAEEIGAKGCEADITSEQGPPRNRSRLPGPNCFDQRRGAWPHCALDGHLRRAVA